MCARKSAIHPIRATEPTATQARGASPRGLERRRSPTGFTRKKRAIDIYREVVEEHAQSFVDARLQIIIDPSAPAGDRLRAMEQLESGALGKPKERVEQVNEEPQELAAMPPSRPTIECRRDRLSRRAKDGRQGRRPAALPPLTIMTTLWSRIVLPRRPC